ncbi:aminodeoxychorismate lyase [Pseudonocardia sp. K10HN5]|uniref:Endolytic murein transglycosylase n=1 Tax=Pseudonocardia acidicola TaxID=2724939 RepID=A0ABX1SKU6_9PSEU|nr:aminodeoxychorismate lyase [Pseudonocardia acidicola]
MLLGVVFGGGAYLLGSIFYSDDYDGPGEGDVVVRVLDGDSTTQIGAMLVRRGVVASTQAFTDAASRTDRIRSVQPGYYQMRSRMSGASAVDKLLDPASRVGQLEIRGGVQLDDTKSPDGTVTPGVLSLVAQASCATLDGRRRCLTVDELRSTMATTDPAELGVPAWALADVRRADPVRRLEGLIVPGVYDVAPGTPPADVLRSLLAVSVARLEATGIVAGARTVGMAPYQVLVVSSLVEKEAITPDMPKVARVIYNRLGAGQRLELDSTVNYPLDVQALRTTAEARAKPGPYNSYAVAGLPPTPIAAPGKAAVAAAIGPVPGPWFFFVRCQTNGTSCFGTTLPEHQENVRQAIANGAF